MPAQCCNEDLMDHIKESLAETLKYSKEGRQVQRDLQWLIDDIAYYYLTRYLGEEECLFYVLCEEQQEKWWGDSKNGRINYKALFEHSFECKECFKSYAVQTEEESRIER